MWCNIEAEAAGEIWHSSLSGVKGLRLESKPLPQLSNPTKWPSFVVGDVNAAACKGDLVCTACLSWAWQTRLLWGLPSPTLAGECHFLPPEQTSLKMWSWISWPVQCCVLVEHYGAAFGFVFRFCKMHWFLLLCCTAFYLTSEIDNQIVK